MNIDKPELAIPKELYESKQAPRQKAKDNLSNDTVKFKPVSVKFVLQFWKDVRERKYAPNTVLYTLNEDVQGFTAGTTGERVGEVVKDVITLKVPYTTTMVKTNMSKVRVKNRENWTTTDVVEFAILPWMLEHNKCVVDVISPEFVGASFQGAFVSQARSCHFDDLLSAVTNHFLAKQPIGQPVISKKPKGKAETKKSGNVFGRMRGKTRAASFAQENRTRKGSNASTMSQANQTADYLSSCYIWLDIFSANQPHLCRAHPDASIQQNRYSVLTHGLHHAIDNFDERLIFFDDFQKPVVISRAWCIWELYGIAKENLSLEVICTPQVMRTLKSDFISGKLNIIYLFSDLDLNKMTCHSPEDLKMITNAVESLPDGFTRLKQVVTDKMFRWVVSFVNTLRESRIKELKASNSAETVEDGDLMLYMADLFDNFGQITLARQYNHAALKIYQSLKADPKSALTMERLGITYSKLGLEDTAMGFFNLAMMYFEVVSPTKGSEEDHLHLTNIYSALAASYNSLNQFEKAFELYDKSFKMLLEINKGGYDSAMAQLLNNMASMKWLLGDKQAAVALQLEAVEVAEKLFGTRHVEVAMKYFNLSGQYLESNEYANAIEYGKKALNIWQEVYGEFHEDTALGHYGLAQIYQAAGNNQEAEKELKITLEYYTMAFPNYPLIPEVRGKLAKVYADTNRKADAKREATLALQDLKKFNVLETDARVQELKTLLKGL